MLGWPEMQAQVAVGGGAPEGIIQALKKRVEREGANFRVNAGNVEAGKVEQ